MSFLATNTSSVTDFGYAFAGCGFINAPDLDTRSARSMASMYQACTALESIPLHSTENVSDMSLMLSNCHNFTDMPQIDMSSATNVAGMWAHCYSLEELPRLDFSNVTNAATFLTGCTALTILGGFDGIKVSFDVSYCPLTKQSLQNLADTMADVTDSPTITLGAANIATAGDSILMQMVAKGWNVAGYMPLEFRSIAYGDPFFVVINNRGGIYYGSDIANLTMLSIDYELNEVRYNSTRAEFWAVGNGVIGYSPDGTSWTWFEQTDNWTGVAFAGYNVVAVSSISTCFFENEGDEMVYAGKFFLNEFKESYSGYKSIDLLASDDDNDSGFYTFAIAGDGIAGVLEFSSDGGWLASKEPAVYPGISFNKIRTLSDGSVVAVGKNSDGYAIYAKGTQPGNVIPILSSATDWTLASQAGWTGVGTRTFGTYHGYACMRTAATYSGVYRLYSAAPIFPIGTTAYVSVDVYAESAGTINVGSESAGGRVKAITTVGEWHTVSMQMTPTAASSFIVYNASTAVIYFKNVRVSYMSVGMTDEDTEFKDVIASKATGSYGPFAAVGVSEGLGFAYGNGSYRDLPKGGFTAVTGLGDAALGATTQTLILLALDGSIWQGYDDQSGDEDVGNVGWTQVANLLDE